MRSFTKPLEFFSMALSTGLGSNIGSFRRRLFRDHLDRPRLRQNEKAEEGRQTEDKL